MKQKFIPIIILILIILIVSSCEIFWGLDYYESGGIYKPQWINDSLIAFVDNTVHVTGTIEHTNYEHISRRIYFLFVSRGILINFENPLLFHFDESTKDSVFISGYDNLKVFNKRESDELQEWTGDPTIKRGLCLNVSDDGERFIYSDTLFNWYSFEIDGIEKYLFKGLANVYDADIDWSTGDIVMVNLDTLLLVNMYTQNSKTFIIESSLPEYSSYVFCQCRIGYDGNIETQIAKTYLDSEVGYTHEEGWGQTLTLGRDSLEFISIEPIKMYRTNSRGDYFSFSNLEEDGNTKGLINVYNSVGELITSKEFGVPTL